MSIRNYVPTYPQLSVNGPPPPHHQTHRVQALPVSVATALQQQISQQQQQQQQQGSSPANQNGGGNVQATEYHLAPCLPFQTPAGAPNFIRHMQNGYAQAHQNQQIYQTQGGPPGVVQNQQQSQSNPAQSQNQQARLTPMSQPTAPPTPPTQQQQQQQQQPPQGAPQYAVQLGQQGIPTGGGGAGNPRASQYRSQSTQQRRPPQPINQQYLYQPQLGSMPYGFVLPPGAHAVRAPAFSYMPFPQVYNQFAPAAPNYQQITAAQANGQQRQNTQPQAAAPTMAQPQTNEYSYQGMDVYPPVMQTTPVPPQQAPPPQAQPQKTVKKPGSKAIQIINPATGKNIFEDDSAGGAAGGSIATVDKAITASHNELNKDEAVEKEQEKEKEPSTPVVSAMSDGPSVDITPKHQVNKNKKVKPPEPAPVLSQPPPPAPPAATTTQPQPQEAPKPVEVEVVAAPVPTTPIVAPLPKDNENNNTTVEATILAQIPVAPEPVEIEKEVVAPVPAVVTPPVLDVNDTNNNNYEEPKPEFEEVKEAAVPVPQDSNNNSTDDKSIMTSPSIRAAPQETPSRKTSSVDGPIDYDDGQWSPANLAGKKYYTRDQLLKLKDLPIATGPPAMTKLPENVANVLMKNNKDTLMNTLTQTMPPPGMTGSIRGNVPFDPINSVAPKFMANQMGGRNPYQKRPSQQGNNKQQGPNNRNSQPGIIKMTLSLQDDVKLNEAENAWKPSHLVKKQDMTEEERVTHELLSTFRSMLNKLTADNFGLLVQQVKTYKIDTGERLDGVIRLVFEKAISEPKFAPTYALLCKEVSNITTAPQGQGEGQQKKNTLRVKLITQCQKEFERHKEESIVFNDIEDKLREIENLPEPERRDEEKSRLEEEHYRVRQRANGTVKFIGELFKIDMLTSKIMRACIEMLLQEVTEEKIERVCKLLTTIGGKMESQDGRQSLNKYFDQLHDMLRPTHAIVKSSRIKFEIQNLQDLRMSNWKSRRVEATPKTLDQIQNEVEQEQQMINYQTRQNAKDDRNRGGNFNNRNNRQQQQQQDSDGWSVQQNKNSRSAPLQFKNIAIPSITSEAKLGGPANYQNFMVQNTNKFAVLPVEADIDGPPRFGGGGGSKNSSMERSRDSRNYYNNNGAAGNAPYSGRSSGSGQGSRNSSRARDDSDGRGGPSRSLQAPRHQQVPAMTASSSMSFSGAVKKEGAAAAPSKPMTPEEVKKNYNAMLEIVNKYREDKLGLEDAIIKLKSLVIGKEVLVEMYNKFLDLKDIDRENLMRLVCELVKTKKVTREDNRAALIDTMELAPDMQCDVPRVYEYIGQLLAELIIASVLTFQEVYQICEADLQSNGEKMLQFIFNATEKRHGAIRLQQIVADTNCDLGKFISDGNLTRWIEANKFTNMLRRGNRGIADVMASIKLMLDDKKSLDVIMNYINSTDCTTDPNFIRHLTTVVIENCCDEYPGSTTAQPSYKLQNARLGDLSQLLQRYIDNETTRELQCINALQNFALDREYPSGLLNSTFEILYDNDVLSLEAFEMWKNDNENQQGKGVAVCSTRQFFTKLEEDKDDDEDGDFYGEEGEAL